MQLSGQALGHHHTSTGSHQKNSTDASILFREFPGKQKLVTPQSVREDKLTSASFKFEEDIDSENSSTVLRDLQLEGSNRDSPNSSMTSVSHTSPTKSQPASKLSQVVDPSPERQKTFVHQRSLVKLKARSSIPARLAPAEYARQCVVAARASRLNPYALHPDEHRLLRDKLCHLHVTVYLNIRNGILRLWVRNPNVSVALEEAVGCAKDERWSHLACFAFEWLIRKGYINHGCVDVPLGVKMTKGRRKESNAQTVVVIGAGMAGLSCARQLTNAFQQFPNSAAPKVIVLEGRKRIGGRIYSHPLSSLRSSLPDNQRATAEMGAHIIVGFEHGNPLDAIIRGQLALNYHSLRDLSTLYDIDGSPVDEHQDTMVERLYNDILDRTGSYRYKPQIQKTAEGDKEAIDTGRDPQSDDDGLTISQYEEAAASGTIDLLLPTKSRRKGAGHKAPKESNPAEGASTSTESQIHLPAAQAAVSMGFALRRSTKRDESFDLDTVARGRTNQTLGNVMDEGVSQYQKFLDLKPKAMRLLNWHFANLEYANATNVEKLSLTGWDQDTGNEFEGEHAQVVGGYQQLPRALWRYPEKLDVRTDKAVNEIRYDASDRDQGKATIVCEDGETIVADKVVVTTPLGVLKSGNMRFKPSLPEWKSGAISRLGFGLLNKVVLVFSSVFWDQTRDMFGLLSEPSYGNGIGQDQYRANRGKFYLFWNCINTSGLPVLIALMAGDAAHEAEQTSDTVIVTEVMERLRKCFPEDTVPDPSETIVTRWKSDRFARGSYSFVAAAAQYGDYDLMAQGIGNLFFAGEATCGTHPATVHGAYLSGQRAASEVLEAIVGPMQLASPPTNNMATPPKNPRHEPIDLTKSSSNASNPNSSKTIAPDTTLTSITPVPKPPPTPAVSNATEPPPKRRKTTDPILPAGTFTRPVKNTPTAAQHAYDVALWNHIYSVLGYAPPKPAKQNINPFLLYQKEHWDAIKAECDAAKAAASSPTTSTPTATPAAGKKGQPSARDEVRIRLGEKWKNEPEESRQKYAEGASRNRELNEQAVREWEAQSREWERRTYEVKDEWVARGNEFEEWVARWERGEE